MGCPVHIWVPAMAALAPAARIARDRLQLFRASRSREATAPAREIRRFAPLNPSQRPTPPSPPEA